MNQNAQHNSSEGTSTVHQNGSSSFQQSNGKPRHFKDQNGQKRTSSRNYRPKNDDHKNGQRKRNNTNRNSQQNTLKKRGVPKELITMVNDVKKQIGKYYSDDEVLAHLEDNNQSVDEVVKILKEKKETNWAARVSKNLPNNVVIQPPQTIETNNNNKQSQQQRKNTNERKSTPKQTPQAPKKEEIDPQEKAQVLEKTIEDQLKEIKQKELELMNMKQELDHFRGGSSQRDVLNKEKEELIEKEKNLREELKKIETRLKEIDSLLLNVEKERAKKISEIEEKFMSEKRK